MSFLPFQHHKHTFLIGVHMYKWDNAFVEKRARDFPYEQLADDVVPLEMEVNLLMPVLNELSLLAATDDKARQYMWLYAYYCVKCLECYYEGYRQPQKVAYYQSLARQIQNRHATKPAPIAQQVSFFESIKRAILQGIEDLSALPKHISKFRNVVGMVNLYRIYWVFCRLTVTQALNMMKGSNLIAMFDALLNRKTDIENIISIIEAPNFIVACSSVGLFATRMLTHTAMLIKHTFMPSEKEAHLSWTTRLALEWDKRQFDYMNDLAWGSVNGITNFAKWSGISSQQANLLIGVFMLFDMSLLLYRRAGLAAVYQQKRLQLESDLQWFDIQQQPEQKKVTEAMLHQLELDWQVTSATYLYYVGAGALLLAGFSATLILAHPALILASWFVATTGVSMYLTRDDFAAYRKAQLTATSETNHSATRLFASALAKQTVMPMLTILVTAVCWEAALLVAMGALIYRGYEHTASTQPALA